MTQAQKRQLIAKHMATAAGRHTLAASMNQPLREFRDYVSVGRRALLTDELPDGALPYYDKDVETPAYVIGEEGQDVLAVAKGERVFVPLFEIATLVRIPATQIKQRRYDIQTRVKEKSQSEVIKVEDKKIFGLFSAIINANNAINAVIPVSQADITIDHLSQAMGLIERHGDNRAANVFMNPKWNQMLRKINSVDNGYYIDFETSKQLMSVGYVGTVFGMQIHTSPAVPEDLIIVTGEPEFTGRIVESMPINVLPADNVELRQVGFSIAEQLGLLVHNPKSVAGIKIG